MSITCVILHLIKFDFGVFIMSKWIDNKTVILTGASSGIGKMLAERLMKEHNCKVIGVARSEKKMLAFVEELGDYA